MLLRKNYMRRRLKEKFQAKKDFVQEESCSERGEWRMKV